MSKSIEYMDSKELKYLAELQEEKLNLCNELLYTQNDIIAKWNDLCTAINHTNSLWRSLKTSDAALIDFIAKIENKYKTVN